MRNLLKVLALCFALYGIECSAQSVSGSVGGYDYVDLGLPSGTLWATYNVGASESWEYGDDFAWGETKPSTDNSLENYKWYVGEKNGYAQYSKYVTNKKNGIIDNKYVLDTEDDAATANWGSPWSMPTDNEVLELISSCDWEWTTNFKGLGVVGQVGTSKKNGNKIFLVGYPEKIDYPCYYWSSESGISSGLISSICVGSSGTELRSLEERNVGLLIRAVVKPDSLTVNFYGLDSMLISSGKVMIGQSPDAPTPPLIEGYKFVGWSDTSFYRGVTQNVNIYAQYKKLVTYVQGVTVSGMVGNYTYVDLGLPSGTMWATYNVGATKPEEFGDYFAWGETKPKKYYDESTYKWWSVSYDAYFFKMITKYNTESEWGTVDNKKELEAGDDAATINWGSAWRMPTSEDFMELVDGCSWEWVDNYNGSGVAGQIGISKKNGNKIFFAAGGTRDIIDICTYDDLLLGKDEFFGSYWSSSLLDSNSFYAIDLGFYEYHGASCFGIGSCVREGGNLIRSVLAENDNGVPTVVSKMLQVYVENTVIHVANAQQNSNIQVFDFNGKVVEKAETDFNGTADISLSVPKGVYVVTVGNQSTKVVIE